MGGRFKVGGVVVGEVQSGRCSCGWEVHLEIDIEIGL